jgi:dTDP-4-dehydrorhamnose 3,5-epimerase
MELTNITIDGVEVDGAYLVKPKVFEDDRGQFIRWNDPKELEKAGLPPFRAETNLSKTWKKGTIRGLHYQDEPHAQSKLMMCTRGKILSVFVDMRPDSKTYKKWVGVELHEDDPTMLLVPKMCANGFQALEDTTYVIYPLTDPYDPSTEKGVRFDDPSIGIRWPLPATLVSDKDRNWPDLTA